MGDVKAGRGLRLVLALEAFFGGYMSFPAGSGLALVLAVWTVHTWLIQNFSATPYLAISALKGSGKSTLLDLLLAVCQRASKTVGPSEAGLFRLIREYEGRTTILWDECEQLGGAKLGLMREVVNAGYTEGGAILRAAKGETGVVWHPVYCPKAFAQIGDLNDTLRDRAILVRLERGTPEKEYDSLSVAAEGAALVSEICQVVDGLSVVQIRPAFLQDRERQIWTAIFSTAAALGLDEATTDRLMQAAGDLVGLKTAPARRHTELRAEAEERQDTEQAARLVADVAKVWRDGERAVFSRVLLARLREIPTSPWRTFRGEGLTEKVMARMLGVVHDTVKIDGKGSKGYRVVDLAKGHGGRFAEVLAALEAADGRKSRPMVKGGKAKR